MRSPDRCRYCRCFAKALYLSRSRLSAKFKAETGVTLVDFILQEKTEEAKRLLRYTDKSATVSKGIASLNHYSKGAMVSWLFDTVCGIRVAGENHFVIAPRPGGTLTYAKAGYDSVYGRVESSWRKEDSKQVFDIFGAVQLYRRRCSSQWSDKCSCFGQVSF